MRLVACARPDGLSATFINERTRLPGDVGASDLTWFRESAAVFPNVALEVLDDFRPNLVTRCVAEDADGHSTWVVGTLFQIDDDLHIVAITISRRHPHHAQIR